VSRFEVRRLRSRDELVLVAGTLTTELRNDDVPSLAAAVAFKIVLALFPSLAAAIAVFSLVTDPGELRQLLERIAIVAPTAVDFLRDPLDRLVRSRAAGLAAVVGVLGGMWASSSAAVTLNRSLSRAYDLIDDRTFIRQRLAALVVMVALLLALVVIFLLLILGDRIENTVLGALPLTPTARDVFDFIATVLRQLLAAGVLMLLFAFIYWVGPNFRQRQPYPWISPGAVLGVVLWLAASGLFGVYVSQFAGNYTGSRSVYGSLGGAIVFMLWLQVSMLALLAGAEVNQVLQLRAGQRSSTAEMAGFGGEPAPFVNTTGPLGMEVGMEVDEAPSPPLAPPPRRADSDRTAEAPAPDERSSHGMPVGGLAASAFGVLSGLLGLIGLLRHRRRE
jgi:membrane protein